MTRVCIIFRFKLTSMHHQHHGDHDDDEDELKENLRQASIKIIEFAVILQSMRRTVCLYSCMHIKMEREPSIYKWINLQSHSYHCRPSFNYIFLLMHQFCNWKWIKIECSKRKLNFNSTSMLIAATIWIKIEKLIADVLELSLSLSFYHSSITSWPILRQFSYVLEE